MSRFVMQSLSKSSIIKKINGYSLIELMIVLSLIGVTSTMAAVYISRQDTDLRKSVSNLNFFLRNAKNEAANRNKPIHVVFVADEPTLSGSGLDFTGDGLVDEKDNLCYLMLCEGCEGANLNFQGKNHLILNTGILPATLDTYIDDGVSAVSFSPFGETSATTRFLSSYIPVPISTTCSSGCQPVSYGITINKVGGIQVEHLEDLSCVSNSYCSN